MEREPNVPESYPSGRGRSSPVLPGPPSTPPTRLQFHLRHLLGLMFACAVLAAGLGYLIRWLATIPLRARLTLANSLPLGILLAILIYFFLRAPWWIRDGNRFRKHWQGIQRRRRELLKWHREQAEAQSTNGEAHGEHDADGESTAHGG